MAIRVIEESPKKRIKVIEEPKGSRLGANLDYAARLGGEVTQGLALQAADELGGIVGAAASYLDPRAKAHVFEGMGPIERYRAIRDEARTRQNEFRADRPVTSTLANVGGAVAQGVATAGTSLGPLMTANPTGVGTAYGLIGGYFGSDAEEPGQLAADTAQGGAVGGLLGRLTQPTANALGSLWTLPARYRQQAMATLPERLVLRDIARDGMTPEKVAANLRKMPQGAAIVDAGGENTRRLGEKVATMPGKSANLATRLIEGRRKAAPARVEGLIDRVFGGKGSEFHQIRNDLEEYMSSRAKPLYEKAFQTPVKQTPTLKGVMNRLSEAAPEVLKEAERKARLDGQVTGTTMRYYDYIKRALDDKIGAALSSGEKDNARIWMDAKRTLLSELDAISPDYAKARATFSSGARMRDALELGRRFMREDAEDIADTLADMTDGEMQMFRLGAARFLRDKVLGKSDTSDVAKAWFNNPLNREKIRAVLGDDSRSFAKLARGMISEGRMFEAQNAIVGNSATARRAAGLLDIASDPALQAQAATEGIRPALGAGIRRWWQENAGALSNESVRDRIGQLIFNGSPSERQEILNRLMRTPDARFLLAPQPYLPALGPQGIIGMPVSPAAGLPATASSAGGLLSSPASGRR